MVEAKCIMDAYDSPSCQSFKMGSTYPIDPDGPLALLKTSGGKLGKFVFEFDRSQTKVEKSAGVKYDVSTPLNPNKGKTPKGYACKHPGCEEVLPHPYALRMHKKTHEAAVEQAA